MSGTTEPLLEVTSLSVSFPSEAGVVAAVRGLSYRVMPGEVLGIVGESGSGKSVSSLAVMGLLPRRARVAGSIRFRGEEMLGRSDKELSGIRGNKMSMIFQDPLSALTPVYTVGDQIAEAVQIHRNVSRQAALERAVELLTIVGIPEAKQRAAAFPHEFSGGMRQRAMIAMAIANDPDLIIADEPTTALDVTIQAQILALIVDLQQRLGTGLILITHDLGVVAQTAQRVIVMYAGRKVEEATVEALFENPRHPYTCGLMASMPEVISQGTRADARLTEIPGMVPSLTNLPPGCAFAPRCTLAIERCRAEYPPLQDFDGHLAACWRADELVTPP